jgi:hypothetical protein
MLTSTPPPTDVVLAAPRTGQMHQAASVLPFRVEGYLLQDQVTQPFSLAETVRVKTWEVVTFLRYRAISQPARVFLKSSACTGDLLFELTKLSLVANPDVKRRPNSPSKSPDLGGDFGTARPRAYTTLISCISNPRHIWGLIRHRIGIYKSNSPSYYRPNFTVSPLKGREITPPTISFR